MKEEKRRIKEKQKDKFVKISFNYSKVFLCKLSVPHLPPHPPLVPVLFIPASLYSIFCRLTHFLLLHLNFSFYFVVIYILIFYTPYHIQYSTTAPTSSSSSSSSSSLCPFILLYLTSFSSTPPASVTWPAHLCVERLPEDRLDPAVRRVDTARCRGTLLQTNCPALSATGTRLSCNTPAYWVSMLHCTTSKRQVANWLLLNYAWFANRNTSRRIWGSHATFVT